MVQGMSPLSATIPHRDETLTGAASFSAASLSLALLSGSLHGRELLAKTLHDIFIVAAHRSQYPCAESVGVIEEPKEQMLGAHIIVPKFQGFLGSVAECPDRQR